jgi:hypothetical protein
VPLPLEQERGDRAVDAAGHGDKDSSRERHRHPNDEPRRGPCQPNVQKAGDSVGGRVETAAESDDGTPLADVLGPRGGGLGPLGRPEVLG